MSREIGLLPDREYLSPDVTHAPPAKSVEFRGPSVRKSHAGVFKSKPCGHGDLPMPIACGVDIWEEGATR